MMYEWRGIDLVDKSRTGNREQRNIFFRKKIKLKKMKFIISQKYILYHSSMIILKNKTIKSIKRHVFSHPTAAGLMPTLLKNLPNPF